MTETCGGCVYDGVPLPGVDVRIEGDGVVQLRGPMLMTGYRRQPQAPVVDGWFRTADRGSWDGRALVVHGRVDDVIVTGGENVVAGDVAARIAEHPAVHDVLVVGVPDGRWGSRVAALVVAAGAPPDIDQLRGWVRDRLGAASAPRQILVVPALPMLATGKPDLQAAREWLGSGGQAAPADTAVSQSADPPSAR
jgi:o-succinylbenzoate---CoA ligase